MTVHRWAPASVEDGVEPVLLIHGFASNTLFNWVKTGWLDPLADAGREILSVDLPGHGASSEINPTGLRIPHLVADLAEVIDQAGGTAAVHGYSLGSRIAWELAYEHDDAVASLVMGGSPVTDEVYRVDAEQARAWAAGGEEPSDERTRRFITVAAALPDQNLPHVVELRLSLAQDRLDPTAKVPTVPTLVVAGERDSIAEGAHALADLVAGTGSPSEFVPLPGRTHVNALTSATYKSAVLEFLAGHRSG
ncbi:alpha/beta fold hydrolase [Nesterenkonia flava]|uniref:Alpha/beta fold hydrolase n=1 Tax=Nesterenkonia flava TaxID=469799 RepID=A0ABU1FS51_9MICC|nr:alpha/beta fold hydrolase [Nesterenkonia flava]MDR5711443.1 alpha/beta fold hydrolase [Nesterenkonia flava]